MRTTRRTLSLLACLLFCATASQAGDWVGNDYYWIWSDAYQTSSTLVHAETSAWTECCNLKVGVSLLNMDHYEYVFSGDEQPDWSFSIYLQASVNLSAPPGTAVMNEVKNEGSNCDVTDCSDFNYYHYDSWVTSPAGSPLLDGPSPDEGIPGDYGSITFPGTDLWEPTDVYTCADMSISNFSGNGSGTAITAQFQVNVNAIRNQQCAISFLTRWGATNDVIFTIN